MASLAEQAHKQILEELKKLVEAESKQSVFAVGGSIPITYLKSHLVCETDDTASEDGSQHGSKGSGEKDNPMMIDSPESATNKPNAAVHNMRCDPITIRWDSIQEKDVSHKVTLPCSDVERPAFEQLLKDCQPATFGLAGKDVLDETYRKAGKIDEDCFSTNFSPYALGMIDTAAQALVPNICRQTNETYGVRAELYKLNVYAAPSGKFKAHVDTPRSKHQVGSLVVCLPSEHEGGQLVLRHQGRLTTFDWSGEKGRTNIQWAAFYSDCEHEVLEVTAGQRVTLTYNLFATCWANTAWVDAERIELCQTLKTLISQPGFCKSGAKIGFHCVHAYPHTNGEVIDTLPTTLKGVDKIMYECFFATRAKVGMRHILNTGDFENLGYESNDLFRQSLQGAHTEDMSRFEDLLKHYHRGEVQDWRGNKHEGWTRKDKYQDWNYIPEDTYAVTANLTPFHFTKVGMNQEDTESIVDAWNPGYKVEATHWLNEQSKSEMALVHGAYGNQADIDTKYVSMAIVLEIPPFDQR